MKVSTFSIKHSNPFKKIKNPQLQAALLAFLISSIAWLCTSLFFSLAPWGNETLSTNDGTHQYIPFLGQFWSIFHEGGSLLYSFDGGLGTNMYLTLVYYLLSPFTFLVLIFSKTQIPAAANLIIILKNIFVIVIMAWYLASKSEKTKPILASSIAIAYGLSYYFLSYSFNFMWMDGIALVPLMLYGLERLNTRKGRLFYTLSLGLAILTNFYMGAIICIFLAFYYVVMQASFDKEGWTNFFTFSLCSICAALIAGVVLIPVIKGLLFDNTSRMSSPDFTLYNNVKYFFSRFLPEADIVKVSNNRGTINLYMGVAPIFGIFLFLFTKLDSKRVKYGLLFLIMLYLFSTQFSFLNWFFHGLYMQRGVPNRYGFLINLLLSIASYYSFSNIAQDSSKKIFLAGFISAWFLGVISAWNSSDSINLALILSGLALLYMAMAFYRGVYFISLLILIESVCGLTHLTPVTLNSAFTQMEEFMTAFESMDLSGRIEFIGKSNLSRNISMLYGTLGGSSFNSIINSSTATFFDRIGCYSGSTFYYVRYGWTPISALFLGVQDIISNKTTLLVPSPYVSTQELDELTVYESPYKVSFGVIPFLDLTVMDDENKFENLNILYPDSFSLLQVNGSIQNKNMSETEKSSIYNKKY
ncbi:MAG: YfhO family protein, partial [Allobaculum sp.]|nr:YfhO family protein [Allobaculum sp.]